MAGEEEEQGVTGFRPGNHFLEFCLNVIFSGHFCVSGLINHGDNVFRVGPESGYERVVHEMDIVVACMQHHRTDRWIVAAGQYGVQLAVSNYRFLLLHCSQT